MHGNKKLLRPALALALWGQMPGVVLATEIEEVLVWGSAMERERGPHAQLTPGALRATNVVTTEDLVNYVPSLVVRRRFIGDANGTLGMRGANMFQTARSQVFADGVPLHYHLQSRWDGAPRWSLISASEIGQVEVLYGPFSAAYGGNAMGGVVLLESRLPEQRELRFDSTVFVQDFNGPGFSESLGGYKSFLSLADRIGDYSFYLSWNHLRSEAQPQTWYFGAAATGAAGDAVHGALPGHNELGTSGLWLGHSGVIDSGTDNLKLKIGRSWDDWDALLNLAWEGRRSASAGNSFLRHADGSSAFGGDFVQDGKAFSLPAARFGESRSTRDSLSLGLRLKGWLGDDLHTELNLNHFAILDDETRSSARNVADPAWTSAGQLSDFGHSGWHTADWKLQHDALAWPGLELTAGLHHARYRLAQTVHDSVDYRASLRGELLAQSGGVTQITAAWLQVWQQLGANWELGLGLREEWWQASEGYHGNAEGSTALPTRSREASSPKFSLAYTPDSNWSLRYSLARAWRFPIVEELYSRYQAFNALNLADPSLAPERGLHQNLAFDWRVPGRELSLSLFHERVQDVIEAQSQTLPGGLSLRTFLPVDEVETQGVEVSVTLNDVLLAGLNLRFNTTWTDARIRRNRVDPMLEGKLWPRMPRWRANLLLDYQLSDTLTAGIGWRHASKSFGRLDNRDTASHVYGAQDAWHFVNLKLDWQATPGLRFGVGVDNVLDELAWVTHPWPGRTFFLEAGWQR